MTVGAIKGGIRNNIIPDEVEMIGTVRTFDPAQRSAIMERMKLIAKNLAEANGATATLEFESGNNPVVYNNPGLTAKMLPSLQRVAGDGNVKMIPLVTGAEDFAFYAQKVPSLFWFVGSTPPGQNLLTAPSNHSPLFFVDESAIGVGARSLAAVAIDYLSQGQGSQGQGSQGQVTQTPPPAPR